MSLRLNDNEILVRNFAFNMGHLSKNVFYIYSNASPESNNMSKFESKINSSFKQIEELKQVKMENFPEIFHNETEYSDYIKMLDNLSSFLKQLINEEGFLQDDKKETLWYFVRSIKNMIYHFKIYYKDEMEESFSI